MTLTETRRSTRKTHICVECGLPIEPWCQHDEPVRLNNRFTGQRRHQVCPIPTRPVQKHFSEAGEKRSGIPWPIYVKIALIALVAGALAAVVIFMTGVA